MGRAWRGSRVADRTSVGGVTNGRSLRIAVVQRVDYSQQESPNRDPSPRSEATAGGRTDVTFHHALHSLVVANFPSEAPRDLRQHPRRDPWPGRPHPPQPPAGAERAVLPADRGPEHGSGGLRGRSGHRRDRADGFGEGLRRRRRYQGDAGQELRRRFPRRLRLQMGERDEKPQAADRRGRRLCARRRLRARDDVRLHPRRRHGEIRPAGDQARRDPRRRRHPAAHPLRRQVEGDGDVPDRADDGCGRGRTLGPRLADRPGRLADRGGAEDGGDHRLDVGVGRLRRQGKRQPRL